MGVKLVFAKRLVLFVTPLVTGSAIATSSSLAATLASSDARLNINNFSHSPTDIFAATDSQAYATAPSGQVTSLADASAGFVVYPGNPSTYALTSTSSTASGNGNNYLGQAQSLAVIIGYNFIVGKGETFSFDLDGFLNLATSIDAPQYERANASGNIFLALYDSTNGSLVDSFTIDGNLTTPNSGDSLVSQASENFLISVAKNYSFGGTQESTSAFINGRFSRSFDSLTYLNLVEFKASQAIVKTPEASNTLALLCLCFIGIGYRFSSSRR